MKTLQESAVNAIRVLSADGIQKAKSGHPGLPLGAASAAYELWQIRIGLTATGLCCPADMVLCFCILCCICLDMGICPKKI